MTKAQELFQQAFDQPRTPRSDAYKAGVLAILRLRVDGIPKKEASCPHPTGTAEADAWFAGTDEGHLITASTSPTNNRLPPMIEHDDLSQPHAILGCSVLAPYRVRLHVAWMLIRYLATLLDPFHAGGTLLVRMSMKTEARLEV